MPMPQGLSETPTRSRAQGKRFLVNKYSSTTSPEGQSCFRYSRVRSQACCFFFFFFFRSITYCSFQHGQPRDVPRNVFHISFLTYLAIGVLYITLALQTIAQKTNTANGWLAWIPIANIILMLEIAKKPIWWSSLFFIPLVNLIMSIIVGMGIAEARSKPSWWGILLIIPVVNLLVPGYLAWSD